MARITPLVDHVYLRPAPDAAPIAVGSAAWYAWLDAATTFAYVDAHGRFTARKERRGPDGGYWKAYRKWGGALHRAYLGTSATLTLERLIVAASAVAPPAPDVASTASERPRAPARGTRAAGPPAAPLLATKLFVPPVRPTLLPRPQLLARLQAGLGGPLTLLSAPAGFGKTTLLAAWRATAAGRAVPLAWVSLDTADRDPARFWSYVLTALDALQPGIAALALPALQSVQPPAIESLLIGVLNRLTTLPADAVLVLDDYHVLQSVAIHAGLTFLLDHLPPQLHLVIATREDPPLPLARLRARGQLTELRTADVRFTAEEAAAFLQTVMDLPLSAAEVTALEAQTEGWIVGLQLAALALREQADPARFIQTFSGSHRYVLDYLADEVIQQLPAHLQTFVLHTAILERLCSSVCAAVVLEGGAAGDTAASQGVLEELERANLFLIPLDDERKWYRYHHLFAEVLRARLQAGAPQATVAALHRRASTWFQAQGLLTEGLPHVLAAQDWEQAAELIEHDGRPLVVAGQVATVLAWVDALPAALVAARPRLAAIHAVLLMYTGRFDAAEARLRDAEHGTRTQTAHAEARLVLGLVATMRGTLVRYTGDLARSVTFAPQALDLLPATDAIGQAGAQVIAAHAFLVTGEVTPAVERAVRAVARPARELGNQFALLRSYTLLARLHVLQGRLRVAAADYRQVVQATPNQEAGLQALVGSGDYYAGLGELLREWNDLDGAEDLLRHSIAQVHGTFAVEAEIVTTAYLALARLQQARGDAAGADETLQQFFDLACARAFFDGLVRRGAAVRAQVWLMQGQLAAAIRWAAASGLEPGDGSSYLQEVEYLTLARVAIAQRRSDPGHALAPMLGMLTRLLVAAEAGARIHSVIEILTLRALAWQAQGEPHTAHGDLERALALAAGEDYVRLFVDEAAPMAALLALIVDRGSPAARYAATLLAACAPATGSAAPRSLVVPHQHAATRPAPQILAEPLSAREREVLGLIAAGQSNQAIADTLVVAVSTVKKHINNLYGKLDVQSRTQALVRARELHLL